MQNKLEVKPGRKQLGEEKWRKREEPKMGKDWQKDWFTARELLEMDFPELDPENLTLGNLLPQSQGMVLFGPEKCLKSTTAIELALP
jgi:hypothetical protein